MMRKSQWVLRWFALGCLVTALLVGAFGAGAADPAAGQSGPPLPRAASGATNGTPGAIYYGATPPGGGEDKPVLVFVQGLHGQASTWWTNGNDMYSRAYNAGYRTAFVDLIDAGGTGGSVWANGQMLAGQLATITAHYGVTSLNMVAHSKGGLDTNAAIVHYGAAAQVQTLFQLSSPNWGSQLADAAYSRWAWWLAAILGMRDDAVYSLQTGQMSAFRSVTDGRGENSYVHYDTSAGTRHGSIFSPLWYSGAYLQFWGPNDGAVTVSSAHHPLGAHIFTDPNLNHDAMPVGRNTWQRIEPYVSHLWRTGRAPEGPPQTGSSDPYAVLPAGHILRGGPLNGRTIERFPVEHGVAGLDLAALTTGGVSVVLHSPDGSTYYPAAVHPGDPTQPLGAAVQHLFQIAGPAAGAWEAEFTSMTPTFSAPGPAPATPAGAYLLVAAPQGGLKVSLTHQDSATTFAPGGSARFTISATDGAAALRSLAVETHLTGDGVSSGTQTLLNDGDALSIALPAAPGVYNLSLTVRGLDAHGAAFERSLTTSFAVTAKR